MDAARHHERVVSDGVLTQAVCRHVRILTQVLPMSTSAVNQEQLYHGVNAMLVALSCTWLYSTHHIS
jgi:hypothetical protein